MQGHNAFGKKDDCLSGYAAVVQYGEKRVGRQRCLSTLQSRDPPARGFLACG
jgi:hypothetical protein